MRTTAPALLPLLRSGVQGRLLALLYMHPDREYSLTDAARLIGTSVKTVQKEASRLVEADFLRDRRQGNVRLLRAAADSIVTRPLTNLLAATYGPLPVLTDLLSGVDGVQAAFIYGSWAARYTGTPGPVPNDVDVLVVGSADRDLLHDLAAAAEERLGRPINLRRVRPAAWVDAESGDPFISSVKGQPLVQLVLEAGEGL